jgi:hypothetical protein
MEHFSVSYVSNKTQGKSVKGKFVSTVCESHSARAYTLCIISVTHSYEQV